VKKPKHEKRMLDDIEELPEEMSDREEAEAEQHQEWMEQEKACNEADEDFEEGDITEDLTEEFEDGRPEE